MGSSLLQGATQTWFLRLLVLVPGADPFNVITVWHTCNSSAICDCSVAHMRVQCDMRLQCDYSVITVWHTCEYSAITV